MGDGLPPNMPFLNRLHKDLTTARVETREFQERHPTLKERVIETKARTDIAEQRAEEPTREMIEMAGHFASQRGI